MSDFASMYFGNIEQLNYSIDLDYEIYHQNGTPIPFDISDLMTLNDTDLENRDSLYLVIPVTVLYALILLAGVIGNVSTCIVIVRNKCMHTATNYYLFSLAISDLLLLLSGLPPDVYRMWYPDVYIFGEVSCVFLGLSSEMSANATVLTITAFTVERYIAICHPFLSHTMSKLSRVVKFIIAIWILALCLAIPQAIQFGVVYSMEEERIASSCTVKWVMVEHAFEISGFVFFVGPMTVITVLYVLIGIKLRTSRLLRPAKNSSMNSNAEPNGSARSYKNGVSQSRAIKMLVAVAVSFFLCWAPFHAQRLLAVYGKNTEEPSLMFLQVYKVLTYLSGVLYFLSTTINPFLYNIMSNKFREAFKTTIAQKCCSRNRRRHHHRSTPLSACSRRPTATTKRTRAPSTTSRLTAATTLTRYQPENNNSTKKHRLLNRSVSAIEVKNNAMNELEPELLKSLNKREENVTLGERLRRSTLAVFGSKSNGFKISRRKSSIELCQRNYDEDKHKASAESLGSHSISNSSLQDMDEDEFTGKELAMFMGQVNHNIV